MRPPPWPRCNGSRFRDCIWHRRGGAHSCSVARNVEWVRTTPGWLPRPSRSTRTSSEPTESRFSVWGLDTSAIGEARRPRASGGSRITAAFLSRTEYLRITGFMLEDLWQPQAGSVSSRGALIMTAPTSRISAIARSESPRAHVDSRDAIVEDRHFEPLSNGVEHRLLYRTGHDPPPPRRILSPIDVV